MCFHHTTGAACSWSADMFLFGSTQILIISNKEADNRYLAVKVKTSESKFRIAQTLLKCPCLCMFYTFTKKTTSQHLPFSDDKSSESAVGKKSLETTGGLQIERRCNIATGTHFIRLQIKQC